VGGISIQIRDGVLFLYETGQISGVSLYCIESLYMHLSIFQVI